ncbi:MAG: hypothetical protein ABIC82_02215 [bacterium]
MERYKFNEIFRTNENGTITPMVDIYINGIQLGKNSISFGPTVTFGGIDFFMYKDKDMAIEKKGDLYIIKGFFR